MISGCSAALPANDRGCFSAMRRLIVGVIPFSVGVASSPGFGVDNDFDQSTMLY